MEVFVLVFVILLTIWTLPTRGDMQLEYLSYVDNTPNSWITLSTSILAPMGRAYHSMTNMEGFNNVLMFGGLGQPFFSDYSNTVV